MYADSQYTEVVPRNKAPRTKPPRKVTNSLPPVAERTQSQSLKHIERPSVPPPERPDSHIKSASISSEEVFEESDKIVELDDISIELNSSESDIYNDCQMSFMDDSENEEETSKAFKDAQSFQNIENTKNAEPTKAKEKSVHFCEKVIDINKFQSNYCSPKEKNVHMKKTVTKAEVLDALKNTSDYGSENQSSNDESSFSKDYHSVGGTPTWFEHYGEDKRQSSTLWFTATTEPSEVHCYDEVNSSAEMCKISKNTSPSEKYRTVIEVGSDNSKNTVSGTSIKLKVNSESQRTRL